MGQHRGNVTGVVNLLAQHPVLDNQSSPILMYGGRVWHKGRYLCNRAAMCISFVSSQPQAVMFPGTSGDRPELPLNLRCDQKRMTCREQCFDCLTGNKMLRIVRSDNAAEYVRINEEIHWKAHN